MAFKRAKFQKLASKMLGPNVAADARKTLTFVRKSGFDYNTQNYASEQRDFVNSVVLNNAHENLQGYEDIDNEVIGIITEYSDDFDVTVDECECMIDGVSYDVVGTWTDPLKVILKANLRAL